jgi:hypothetical protein
MEKVEKGKQIFDSKKKIVVSILFLHKFFAANSKKFFELSPYFSTSTISTYLGRSLPSVFPVDVNLAF